MGGVTISFDDDLNHSTIPAEIFASSTFSIDVIMTLSESTDEISAYGFSVDYDSTKLTATNVVHDLPSDFITPSNPTLDDANGRVGRFTAAVTSTGNPLEGPGVFNLGTIVFGLKPGANGTAGISTFVSNDGIDGFLKPGGDPATLSGNAALNVTAVPEPSSAIFLLLTLVLLSERQWSRSHIS